MTRNGIQADEFYSPGWVAEALASALPDSLSGSVLDPAVGGGALLAAVEARFGERVTLLGIDVSTDAVRRVRQAHPAWKVSNADLLKTPSRTASTAWRAAHHGDLAAVVMNPPFSYRGNGGEFAEYGAFYGRVAPSIRFLIEVMRSLNPRHGFYAILPDGALDAERHEPFWEELTREYDVDRVSRLGNSSFQGARVSTSVVRIRRSAAARTTPMQPVESSPQTTAVRTPLSCRCVELVRGRVPMHALPALTEIGPRSPVMHTTDLGLTTVLRTAPDRLADTAPLLLIGRVGKWRTARLIDVGRVVLSDCLFGIRPRDKARVGELVDSLNGLEPELRSRMRGTGAPYLTLKDVSRVLQTHDWHVHVVKASQDTGDCCCTAPQACAKELPLTAVDDAPVLTRASTATPPPERLHAGG